MDASTSMKMALPMDKRAGSFSSPLTSTSSTPNHFSRAESRLQVVSTSASAAPTTSTYQSFNDLKFEHTLVDTLPGDEQTEVFVRQVQGAVYSLAHPTDPMKDDQSNMLGGRASKSIMDTSVGTEGNNGNGRKLPPILEVPEPKMLAWSSKCAALFDLSPTEGYDNEEAVQVLGGFKVLESMRPYAQCYGGHQFGSWAGQLGDGRAITLGEYVNSKGERWEMQLKGAGKTPYSRFADGRAVLRSSIREFLCSEAMAALGVPTTRALSLVFTGAGVVRDQFYSGDPQIEPGAVVCRVAPSLLRLGTFQLPASRGDKELVKKIADYAIDYHFPQLKQYSEDADDENNRYVHLLRTVIRTNCELVTKWQSVGFVHGVLNTDNTSILGLTIDYGPYGFLDEFDPSYTPNTTDLPGRRYCYARQPSVILWNLLQFAQSIAFLTGIKPAERELNLYRTYFDECITEQWRRKFGLRAWRENTDDTLMEQCFEYMENYKVDFTLFFRNLARLPCDEIIKMLNSKNAESVNRNASEIESVSESVSAEVPADIQHSVISTLKDLNILFEDNLPSDVSQTQWVQWVIQYCHRVVSDLSNQPGDSNLNRNMNPNPNPNLNPNPNAVPESDPYHTNPTTSEWTMQSRRDVMNAINPKFILRNHYAQKCIESAANGDTGPLLLLHQILQNPYDDIPRDINGNVIGEDLWSDFVQRPGILDKRPGVCVNSCSS